MHSRVPHDVTGQSEESQAVHEKPRAKLNFDDKTKQKKHTPGKKVYQREMGGDRGNKKQAQAGRDALT